MLNGKKLIEIRKGGFVNKGAELMLHSVLNKLKSEFPDAQYVMNPTTFSGSAPYLKRACLGFYQKVHLYKFGIQFGKFEFLIPLKIREMFGIVLNKDIDIVIDISGFSYGDQLGKYNTLELVNSLKKWKKNGTKVILMPQAFGPFESPKIKKKMRFVIENVDLIYARDQSSFDYLKSVCHKCLNIKKAPDISILTEGKVSDDFNILSNQFCIIPNARMIDKTDPKVRKVYLPFLISIAKYLYNKGHKPFILVHEGPKDLLLARKIRDSVSEHVKIIIESDALIIKAIIGKSSALISSRFHGVVSGLSQGVPALATSWSHKYQMLFEDYGFSEGILDLNLSENELFKKVDILLDESKKQKIVKLLNSKNEILKKESNKMWEEILHDLKDN